MRQLLRTAYCVLRISVPVLSAAACAPARPAPSTVPQPSADAAGELPPLTMSRVAEGGAGRIQRFEAVDQDLRVVVRSLAESFGLGYQIDPEVSGTVTTRLEGVTLEQALASVVPARYSYQIEGNVLRVSGARMQTRTFALDYLALLRMTSTSTVVQRQIGSGGVGVGTGGGVNTQTGVSGALGIGGGGGGDVITTSTVTDLWEEIRVAVEALTFDTQSTDTAGSPRVSAATGAASVSSRPYSRTAGDGRRIIINPMAGHITVTAPPAVLAQVEAFIRNFEASVQRQVIIEAKIVEVSLSNRFRFGVDWSTLAADPKLSIVLGTGDVTATNAVGIKIGGGQSEVLAVLRALESQGEVSVLSAPRINVMNNQRASFDATTNEIFFAITQVPISSATGAITFQTQAIPQQVTVGVVLDVLAHIGADNTVTMNIRPLVSSVTDFAELSLPDGTSTRVPEVSRRQADTFARVRNGETVVIGGLMERKRIRNTTGVPGLRNIPIVGRVFTGVSRDDERNELVIFITPTVVIGPAVAAQ